jgi:arabinogalactan endo-1,4-beta-galactosidase
MSVLLDFHLSDRWADPHHQAVPAAWLPVVHDTKLLGDSLYQYVYGVMTGLAQKGLWPEMVQVGNEVNKGILLSPEADSVWTLDWARNAELFSHGIAAVRDAEHDTGQRTGVMLHVADPTNAEWMLDGFVRHGVTDFDWIGLSYYWAWHHPTTIADCAAIIETLRDDFPEKEVMVVETGYPWTDGWNDNAANIISELHPDYAPASPDAQYRWLRDLTQAVQQAGGRGVVYWEPYWVSSPCYTPWGQGSHQEHAAFFDFENRLMPTAGFRWLNDARGGAYKPGEPHKASADPAPWRILVNAFSGQVVLRHVGGKPPKGTTWSLLDENKAILRTEAWSTWETELDLSDMPAGVYSVRIAAHGDNRYAKQFRLGGD